MLIVLYISKIFSFKLFHFILFAMRGKGRKFTGAVKMEVNFGLGKSL